VPNVHERKNDVKSLRQYSIEIEHYLQISISKHLSLKISRPESKNVRHHREQDDKWQHRCEISEYFVNYGGKNQIGRGIHLKEWFL
jgi:hypothetical protein